MDEELHGEELAEFLAGYRAASKGEPFWEHNTDRWLEGYHFFWLSRAERADELRRATRH